MDIPKLIWLNGPPGIGKSTIARRYVDDHPLALCLDLDLIRSSIGQWDTHQQASGRVARRMALAMAREHLAEGHDVIVPQLLVRSAFADELAALSESFHEIVLLDDKASVLSRFAARASDPALARHHAAAARMLGGDLAGVYEELLVFLGDRPGAVHIRTRAGDVDGTYAAVLRAL